MFVAYFFIFRYEVRPGNLTNDDIGDDLWITYFIKNGNISETVQDSDIVPMYD